MARFILRRLISVIALAVLVTFVAYLIVFSNGEGIARSVLGNTATDEAVAAKVVELGLDQPVLAQYGEWLLGAVQGDLSRSYFTQEAVTSILGARLPVTLSIVIISVILTALISVLVGVAAAVYGGWIDRVLQFGAVLGAAVPPFILAVGLVLVFAVSLRLFPATGYTPPAQGLDVWAQGLVLPVVAILVGTVASSAQQFRGSVADELRRDYVRTLRARGIPERQIIFRNVLRGAAAPGLTVLGLQTIGLFGGVVLIEQVFAIPGIGQLTVSSALGGDIPVLMGCVLFTVVVVIIVNLLADLVIGWVNPKARTA